MLQKRGDQFISSELVFLAALEEKGPAGEALRNAKVNKETLEKSIEKIRGGESVKDASAEETRQALDKYTIDLTARARRGVLIRDRAGR